MRYRSLVEAIPAITYLEHASPEAPRESRFAFVSPRDRAVPGFTPDEATTDPAVLRADPAPGRPAAHPRGQRAGGVDRGAVRRGVPTDHPGRRDPLDARPLRSWSATTTARRASGTESRSTSPTARRPNATCGCSRSATALWSNRSRAVTFIETPGAPPGRDLVHVPEPPGRGHLRLHERRAPREPNPPRRARASRGPRTRLRRERTRRGDGRDLQRGVPDRPPRRPASSWLDSRAVLVRDDEGRPRFWQGVAIDVTAHRELGAGTAISRGWCSGSSAATPTRSAPRPAGPSAGAHGGSRAGTRAGPWGARPSRPPAGSSRGSR